jgi:hypothetical protein
MRRGHGRRPTITFALQRLLASRWRRWRDCGTVPTNPVPAGILQPASGGHFGYCEASTVRPAIQPVTDPMAVECAVGAEVLLAFHALTALGALGQFHISHPRGDHGFARGFEAFMPSRTHRRMESSQPVCNPTPSPRPRCVARLRQPQWQRRLDRLSTGTISLTPQMLPILTSEYPRIMALIPLATQAATL